MGLLQGAVKTTDLYTWSPGVEQRSLRAWSSYLQQMSSEVGKIEEKTRDDWFQIVLLPKNIEGLPFLATNISKCQSHIFPQARWWFHPGFLCISTIKISSPSPFLVTDPIISLHFSSPSLFDRSYHKFSLFLVTGPMISLHFPPFLVLLSQVYMVSVSTWHYSQLMNLSVRQLVS